MPLEKVAPGSPIQRWAADHNAFVDAARAEQMRQLTIGVPNSSVTHSPGEVDIRNDSGATRREGDILALNGVVFSATQNLATYKYQRTWKGILPTLAQVGKFAVLTTPAASGRYAKAILTGEVACIIQVNHIQHQYADIAAGSARLTSNWYGGAEILDKAAGTGEKWAVVKLGAFFAGKIYGKTNVDINPEASGLVTVWYAGLQSAPAATVTGHLMRLADELIVATTHVAMEYQRDEQKLVIVNAKCVPGD
jgi:hypothetical protein